MPWFFYLLLFFLIVWGIIWKGMALWKAGRKGDKFWYIVLLLFNTAGILEIIYIFFLNKRNKA